MKCISCHKKISKEGISFCPHCGAYLRQENIKKKKNIYFYFIIIIIWIIAGYFLLNLSDEKYYFENLSSENTKEDSDDSNISQSESSQTNAEINNENSSSNDKQNEEQSTVETPPIIEETPTPANAIVEKGKTSVVYNNKYIKKYSIANWQDVLKYIQQDSLSQKSSCSQEIISIENSIITKYGIIAVNLCEMDVDFATELQNVIEYIYNNYPNSRNYLTNITLANLEENTSYMAAFMPIFTFITNNNISGYPMGIKSQIILNAKYFLDSAKISNSVKYGVKTGYFPKNATRSSTVAHEFGHYLSYVAMLNYYHTNALNFVTTTNASMLYTVYDDFNAGNFSYAIIKAAYEEYCLSYNDLPNIDAFRNTISTYAMAKDNSGMYIYDETIAEAFHDYYLNGNDASIASRLIITQLKKYL